MARNDSGWEETATSRFPPATLGIGTTTSSLTEKLQVDGGSLFLNGENQGVIVGESGRKTVGFMDTTGREAGIWRVAGQDFEIGRVSDDDIKSLGGWPSVDLYISGNGNVGIGTTPNWSAKLHVVAEGGFGNRVPIVAQSESTFFAAVDPGGNDRFGINLDGDGTSYRVTFVDAYDGLWHTSLTLKNGNVGIGPTNTVPTAPRTTLHLEDHRSNRVKRDELTTALKPENATILLYCNEKDDKDWSGIGITDTGDIWLRVGGLNPYNGHHDQRIFYFSKLLNEVEVI